MRGNDSGVIRSSALVLLGLALASGALGCPPAKPARGPDGGASQAAPPRLCNPHSVILVRHAEKVTDDPKERDPELTPKGRERAMRLATLLGKTTISRLVATEYMRTQHTLAPLSERAGKPIEVRSAAQTNDFVRELREAPPGSTTVVATHSNVLPMIVRELGGGPLRDVGADGALPESDYSRVLVVSVGCSASASVVELSSD
jgi:broad specificity phosphatase PhoE